MMLQFILKRKNGKAGKIYLISVVPLMGKYIGHLSTQATMWEIKSGWVKKVEHFVSTINRKFIFTKATINLRLTERLKATEDLNLEGIVMAETMGVAIGIGLLLTAIIIGITDSALSFIAFALGFVVGLALLIYAGAKYNR